MFDEAIFLRTTFHDGVQFDGAVFDIPHLQRRPISHLRAVCARSIRSGRRFRGAKYHGAARFIDRKFSRTAGFNDAEFHSVSTLCAEFGGDIVFDGATAANAPGAERVWPDGWQVSLDNDGLERLMRRPNQRSDETIPETISRCQDNCVTSS